MSEPIIYLTKAQKAEILLQKTQIENQIRNLLKADKKFQASLLEKTIASLDRPTYEEAVAQKLPMRDYELLPGTGLTVRELKEPKFEEKIRESIKEHVAELKAPIAKANAALYAKLSAPAQQPSDKIGSIMAETDFKYKFIPGRSMRKFTNKTKERELNIIADINAQIKNEYFSARQDTLKEMLYATYDSDEVIAPQQYKLYPRAPYNHPYNNKNLASIEAFMGLAPNTLATMNHSEKILFSQGVKINDANVARYRNVVTIDFPQDCAHLIAKYLKTQMGDFDYKQVNTPNRNAIAAYQLVSNCPSLFISQSEVSDIGKFMDKFKYSWAVVFIGNDNRSGHICLAINLSETFSKDAEPKITFTYNYPGAFIFGSRLDVDTLRLINDIPHNENLSVHTKGKLEDFFLGLGALKFEEVSRILNSENDDYVYRAADAYHPLINEFMPDHYRLGVVNEHSKFMNPKRVWTFNGQSADLTIKDKVAPQCQYPRVAKLHSQEYFDRRMTVTTISSKYSCLKALLHHITLKECFSRINLRYPETRADRATKSDIYNYSDALLANGFHHKIHVLHDLYPDTETILNKRKIRNSRYRWNIILCPKDDNKYHCIIVDKYDENRVGRHIAHVEELSDVAVCGGDVDTTIELEQESNDSLKQVSNAVNLGIIVLMIQLLTCFSWDNQYPWIAYIISHILFYITMELINIYDKSYAGFAQRTLVNKYHMDTRLIIIFKCMLLCGLTGMSVANLISPINYTMHMSTQIHNKSIIYSLFKNFPDLNDYQDSYILGGPGKKQYQTHKLYNNSYDDDYYHNEKQRREDDYFYDESAPYNQKNYQGHKKDDDLLDELLVEPQEDDAYDALYDIYLNEYANKNNKKQKKKYQDDNSYDKQPPKNNYKEEYPRINKPQVKYVPKTDQNISPPAPVIINKDEPQQNSITKDPINKKKPVLNLKAVQFVPDNSNIVNPISNKDIGNQSIANATKIDDKKDNSINPTITKNNDDLIEYTDIPNHQLMNLINLLINDEQPIEKIEEVVISTNTTTNPNSNNDSGSDSKDNTSNTTVENNPSNINNVINLSLQPSSSIVTTVSPNSNLTTPNKTVDTVTVKDTSKTVTSQDDNISDVSVDSETDDKVGSINPITVPTKSNIPTQTPKQDNTLLNLLAQSNLKALEKLSVIKPEPKKDDKPIDVLKPYQQRDSRWLMGRSKSSISWSTVKEFKNRRDLYTINWIQNESISKMRQTNSIVLVQAYDMEWFSGSWDQPTCGKLAVVYMFGMCTANYYYIRAIGDLITDTTTDNLNGTHAIIELLFENITESYSADPFMSEQFKLFKRGVPVTLEFALYVAKHFSTEVRIGSHGTKLKDNITKTSFPYYTEFLPTSQADAAPYAPKIMLSFLPNNDNKLIPHVYIPYHKSIYTPIPRTVPLVTMHCAYDAINAMRPTVQADFYDFVYSIRSFYNDGLERGRLVGDGMVDFSEVFQYCNSISLPLIILNYGTDTTLANVIAAKNGAKHILGFNQNHYFIPQSSYRTPPDYIKFVSNKQAPKDAIYQWLDGRYMDEVELAEYVKSKKTIKPKTITNSDKGNDNKANVKTNKLITKLTGLTSLECEKVFNPNFDVTKNYSESNEMYIPSKKDSYKDNVVSNKEVSESAPEPYKPIGEQWILDNDFQIIDINQSNTYLSIEKVSITMWNNNFMIPALTTPLTTATNTRTMYTYLKYSTIAHLAQLYKRKINVTRWPTGTNKLPFIEEDSTKPYDINFSDIQSKDQLKTTPTQFIFYFRYAPEFKKSTLFFTDIVATRTFKIEHPAEFNDYVFDSATDVFYPDPDNKNIYYSKLNEALIGNHAYFGVAKYKAQPTTYDPLFAYKNIIQKMIDAEYTTTLNEDMIKKFSVRSANYLTHVTKATYLPTDISNFIKSLTNQLFNETISMVNNDHEAIRFPNWFEIQYKNFSNNNFYVPTKKELFDVFTKTYDNIKSCKNISGPRAMLYSSIIIHLILACIFDFWISFISMCCFFYYFNTIDLIVNKSLILYILVLRNQVNVDRDDYIASLSLKYKPIYYLNITDYKIMLETWNTNACKSWIQGKFITYCMLPSFYVLTADKLTNEQRKIKSMNELHTENWVYATPSIIKYDNDRQISHKEATEGVVTAKPFTIKNIAESKLDCYINLCNNIYKNMSHFIRLMPLKLKIGCCFIIFTFLYLLYHNYRVSYLGTNLNQIYDTFIKPIFELITRIIRNTYELIQNGLPKEYWVVDNKTPDLGIHPIGQAPNSFQNSYELGGYATITDKNYDNIQHPNQAISSMKMFKIDGTPVSNIYEMKEYINSLEEYKNKPLDSKEVHMKYTRTGPSFENSINKISPHVMEVNNKNAFSALFFRHTAATTLPTKRMIKEYQAKSEKFVRKFVAEAYSYFDTEPCFSLEDYINSLPAQKRPAYTSYLEKWRKDPTIPLLLTVMMKSGEQHYDHVEDIKPRCLWNPSDQLKLFMGAYNKQLIDITKKIFPQFTHGLDCHDLEKKIEKQYKTINDPIFGAGDGSSHDAHQHDFKIRCIDNKIHELLVPIYCAKNGFDLHMTSECVKAATTLDFPFVLYYTGTRTTMVRGIVHGTVFSGHTTRTTWGNTIRVIFDIYIILSRAQLIGKVKFFVAGDDTLFIMSKENMYIFEATMNLYWGYGPNMFGLGYKIKKFNWLGNCIDFLSKTGGVTPDGSIRLHRQFHRTIISGNYTHKLRRAFTASDHAWAITSQLLSWVGDLPILRDYIVYRRKTVKHTEPKNKDLIYWNDPEAWYKLVSHSNKAVKDDPNHYEGLRNYLYNSAYSFLPDFENNALFFDHLIDINYID